MYGYNLLHSTRGDVINYGPYSDFFLWHSEFLFAGVARMGFSAMTHSLYATEAATRLLDACLYMTVFLALVNI